MTTARVSWNDYFMGIALSVSTRATCDRQHVGAVIARDKSILATGYNGSVRGLSHCDDVGHLMEEGHCVRTIHAEANALVQAARNGVRISGASIYVTTIPCWGCFRLIANAGIVEIYYGGMYRRDQRISICSKINILPIHMAFSLHLKKKTGEWFLYWFPSAHARWAATEPSTRC